MLYYYLVTVYKGIIGLVTPERLMGVALGALGVYVLWMCISLIASFQRKFNTRCQKLIEFVIKTNDIEKHPDWIDKKTEELSSGFGFGWKKFRNCEVGKPSDFITRRESLDVEVNGGLHNNGKTMMKAYITFVTVVLAILNFVYIGGENPLTFITFAETLFLPFIFYIVIQLLYFLHNSIRQKLYKMDIESFYEIIDLLDSKFEKRGRLVSVENESVAEDEEPEEEKSETEQLEENPEQEEVQDEENTLDKYDIFKKKNIDISKIMSESSKADTSLPYINVDSDYVIKDDDQVGAKQVGQDDNMSTIFGGMMQNTSGIKKNSFVDVEKKMAEIDEDKLEKLSKFEIKVDADENIEEKKDETESIQTENLGEKENQSNEDIKDESQSEVDDKTDDDISVNNNQNEKKFKVEINLNDEMKPNSTFGHDADIPVNTNKFIEIEKNEQNSNLDEENIASVVSSFKASRSKLATGGMIIERNEPITKRDRGNTYKETEQETTQKVFEEPVKQEINRPIADDNTENILNTLKSGNGSYDNSYTGNQVFAPTTNYGSVTYDQGYTYNTPQQMFQPQMNNQMQGYGYNSQPVYSNYSQPAYPMGVPNMNQADSYGYYDEPEMEDVVEEKQKKKKAVISKENEPRPRNLKSNSKKTVKEEVEEVEKRGRPKKPEYTESMVIENDKQFNEVLARAEKLMRKNEEGLSESQSKRIEKEIKILMDAMNRYKERK